MSYDPHSHDEFFEGLDSAVAESSGKPASFAVAKQVFANDDEFLTYCQEVIWRKERITRTKLIPLFYYYGKTMKDFDKIEPLLLSRSVVILADPTDPSNKEVISRGRIIKEGNGLRGRAKRGTVVYEYIVNTQNKTACDHAKGKI